MGTVISLFIPFTLGTIMVAMGLGLEMRDFRRVFQRPAPLVAGLTAQLLLLPAVAFGLAYGLALPPLLAVGLVLVSACPGGPSSNLFSVAARGDRALSVTLTAFSGFLTVVTLPLVLLLAMSTFVGEAERISIPLGDTMTRIFGVVVVPLLSAMALRARWPEAAMRWEPRVRIGAAVLLTVLVVGAIATERSRIAEYWDAVGVAVLLLMALTISLGLTLGGLLRLPRRSIITIGVEVGMQNSALAIAVAYTILDSGDIAVPALAYGVFMYGACALLIPIGRRWVGGEEG